MYQRILLSLDGSDQGEQALSHAIAQAKQFGAELMVLKALPPAPIMHGLNEDTRQWVGKYPLSLAREHLKKVSDAVEQHGVAVQVFTIEDNSPAKVARSAEERLADLIVMPTRRPSGIGRWFGSNLAERVARETEIPVLLVLDSDNGQNGS